MLRTLPAGSRLLKCHLRTVLAHGWRTGRLGRIGHISLVEQSVLLLPLAARFPLAFPRQSSAAGFHIPWNRPRSVCPLHAPLCPLAFARSGFAPVAKDQSGGPACRVSAPQNPSRGLRRVG